MICVGSKYNYRVKSRYVKWFSVGTGGGYLLTEIFSMVKFMHTVPLVLSIYHQLRLNCLLCGLGLVFIYALFLCIHVC